MREVFNPSAIHPPLANYSHAVSGKGRTLFVSGQLGLGPDGSLPESAGEQAAQCFANIDAILREAGLNSGHVMRINAYVTDRAFLAEYMRVRDAWLGGVEDPPASTLLITAGFARPEMKVEIEVTACF